MLNWLKQLIADPNGIPDDARIISIGLIITFIVKTFLVSGTFDFQSWGLGAGALVAGIGGLFGFRKDN
jgi:hypothetical protein